jgi:hypothetical protein
MNKILDVVEDIKQNITDNQYKTIMDSLMEIHKIKNKNINNENTSYKWFALLNWLDTKLELTDDYSDVIKRKELYKYIISKFYKDLYFKNIDFMKQVLKLFFMHEKNYQYDTQYFRYVQYRR